MTRSTFVLMAMMFSVNLSAQSVIDNSIVVHGKVGQAGEAGRGEIVNQTVRMGPCGVEKSETVSSSSPKVEVATKVLVELIRGLPDEVLLEELARRGLHPEQKKAAAHPPAVGAGPSPDQKGAVSSLPASPQSPPTAKGP